MEVEVREGGMKYKELVGSLNDSISKRNVDIHSLDIRPREGEIQAVIA